MTHGAVVRAAQPDDLDAIRSLAVATGLLSVDEAEALLAAPPDDDKSGLWLVAATPSGAVAGAACCSREPVSDRVWNLQLLAVDPALQRSGVGTALVAHVEAGLAALPEPASAVVIETSGTESFAPIRAFYSRLGYVRVGQVPNYYGPDDSKVVLWKALATG